MSRAQPWGWVLGAVILATGAIRAESPGTGPASRPASSVKLTLPWSRLRTLSDEQKLRIHTIHRKALDEINAIRDREEADILALLSEDQKSELRQLDEERRAREKARRAEMRQSQGRGGTSTDKETK